MSAERCVTCEEITAEKNTWGDGPWQQEPDRVAWEHAGFPCILHRGPGGHWCGYVGVPPGHAFHGKSYNDVDGRVNAHGGLTYSEPCGGHICHIPKPGEPDNVWWFGFDAAHAGDLCPASEARLRSYGRPPRMELPERFRDHYRDQAYMTAETENLAEQLAALAK